MMSHAGVVAPRGRRSARPARSLAPSAKCGRAGVRSTLKRSRPSGFTSRSDKPAGWNLLFPVRRPVRFRRPAHAATSERMLVCAGKAALALRCPASQARLDRSRCEVVRVRVCTALSAQVVAGAEGRKETRRAAILPTAAVSSSIMCPSYRPPSTPTCTRDLTPEAIMLVKLECGDSGCP